MTRQTRKTRSRRLFSPTLSAVLRGMAVFLLFTHQAWANIVCCGVNGIEYQQSYRQIIEEHDSFEKMAIKSGHCHAAVLAEKKQPNADHQVTRFTNSPEGFPWCCQATMVAEPQPPILSSDEQAQIDAAPAFFTPPQLVALAYTDAHSPPPKSRPIFLIISCFLI